MRYSTSDLDDLAEWAAECATDADLADLMAEPASALDAPYLPQSTRSDHA